MQRLRGHAIHATTPNELFYFDNAHMEKGTGPEVYVHILTDDVT